MAISQQMTARDRAVLVLTRFFDRFEHNSSDWRHTDVAEMVDALVDAARAPESEHTRALAAGADNPGNLSNVLRERL